MDPLAILKEFCVGGQLEDIVIQDDRVKFGDKYSFPKQQPTAFRSKEGQGGYYSLEAVAFFAKNILRNPNAMGQYVAAAVRSKTEQIQLQDRAPLVDYLSGKVQHTVHISDVVPTVTFYEPAAKKQRVADEGEAAALKHLLEQEKQLRDRNSLLCAPGADFKPVLVMLDKVLAARKAIEMQAQKAAEAAKKQQQQKPGSVQQQRPQQQQQQQQKQQAPAFMKPSARMERNDVAGQLKALGGDASLAANIGYGYGLQSEAVKAGAAAAAATGSGGGSSSRPSSQQQQHRSSSGSGKSDPRASAAAAAAAAAGSKSGHHQKSSGGGSTVKHGDPPIILVPSGVTAMINMFNAKQFLEEGRFVPSAEAAAAVNSIKPMRLEYKRNALRQGPHFPRYHITDKVPRPGHPDWKRVVAVIVQGKAWQFKDFPFKGADKGDLREAFTQLFGAYFYYSDEKVPEAVDGWKVVKLPLRRAARHLDHTVMLDFYTKLDAFLQGRRCELAY